jgi:hypothetical protein
MILKTPDDPFDPELETGGASCAAR